MARCGLRQSLILQIGAYLSGVLAVGWGIASLERNDLPGLYLGAALGALMTFNAFWSQRRSAAAEDEYPIRPVPTYFTILALASWLATTWYNTTPANFPPALAVEALALTFSIYLLRLRELVLLGQGFLLLGQFAWLLRFILPSTFPRPRRRDHGWRTQSLAVSHALGLPECQRILPDRKLVGAGARILRGRHGVARTGVSLAWPRGARFRAGTRRHFRCLETGDALSHSEFHGAWHRVARTRLHLQQIPGEN